MTVSNVLKDKIILVVDDEEDILDSVEEILEDCIVKKASDFSTAQQYLRSYTYDIVILDIMGVNGFELLRIAIDRGFPTVMLTALAINPEALEKSIKLGAVAFLPKDELYNLDKFLIDIIKEDGRPIWKNLFDKLGGFFNERFGPDWKQKKRFFEKFEESLRNDKNCF